MDLDLKAVLEGRRHLLLDGGMGTMLQKPASRQATCRSS